MLRVLIYRSNFLSPVALELPRWQQFMVLMTMIMGVLVVDGASFISYLSFSLGL